jgi:hypothetical protein
MSNGHNVAMSLMLATYATPPETVKVQSVKVKADKPPMRKLRTVESLPSNGGNTTPKMVTTIPLPVKDSLDARAFLLAMRTAGQRCTADGKVYTDPAHIRNDQIIAIAGFIGWDNSLDFGTQDSTARLKATSDLHPMPATPAFRRINNSIVGYVSGMPNETAKRLGDLQGRERLAVDTMSEHVKLAKEATNDQDKGMHEALAQVEEERLVQIRKDLLDLL